MRDDSGLDQSDSIRNHDKRESIGLAHKSNVGICGERPIDKSKKVWATGRIMGPSVVIEAVGWASLKGKRSAVLNILVGKPLRHIQLEMLSRELDLLTLEFGRKV